MTFGDRISKTETTYEALPHRLLLCRRKTRLRRLAAILAAEFTKKAILYDKFHEAEFGRRDLDIYLPELYHKQSELIVVVLCQDYETKEWCGLEWTAIHALLKNRKDDMVMLCRF